MMMILILLLLIIIIIIIIIPLRKLDVNRLPLFQYTIYIYSRLILLFSC